MLVSTKASACTAGYRNGGMGYALMTDWEMSTKIGAAIAEMSDKKSGRSVWNTPHTEAAGVS